MVANLSSTDTDSHSICRPQRLETKAKPHLERKNEKTSSTPYETTTDSISSPKALYKMKQNAKNMGISPSKIEFQIYKPNGRRVHYLTKKRPKLSPKKFRRHTSSSRQKLVEENGRSEKKPPFQEVPPGVPSEENASDLVEKNLFSRLCGSFSHMKQAPIPNANQEADTDSEGPVEKIDIYYFDHGNSAYFRTTDCPPNIFADAIAQQATYYATRFWAEIFGSIHIGVTFVIAFVLQAYRFALYSILRPIIVGFFQMTADYLIKPIITIIFNGLLQPVLIFFYNIFSSIRDMLEPLAEALDNFMKPVARVFRAMRLITVTARYGTDKSDVNAV